MGDSETSFRGVVFAIDGRASPMVLAPLCSPEKRALIVGLYEQRTCIAILVARTPPFPLYTVLLKRVDALTRVYQRETRGFIVEHRKPPSPLSSVVSRKSREQINCPEEKTSTRN